MSIGWVWYYSSAPFTFWIALATASLFNLFAAESKGLQDFHLKLPLLGVCTLCRASLGCIYGVAHAILKYQIQ